MTLAKQAIIEQIPEAVRGPLLDLISNKYGNYVDMGTGMFLQVVKQEYITFTEPKKELNMYEAFDLMRRIDGTSGGNR